jgi:hypothetical protein
MEEQHGAGEHLDGALVLGGDMAGLYREAGPDIIRAVEDPPVRDP